MSMSVSYPWSKLKPGEGFFVPSLDVAKTREEGLRQALRQGALRVDAHYTVKNGLIGVWFCLKPPSRR